MAARKKVKKARGKTGIAKRPLFPVLRVHADIAPRALDHAQRSKLDRILGKPASAAFLENVEAALGIYLVDRKVVAAATPAKVHDRLADVRLTIERLVGQIHGLPDTDHSLILQQFSKESLRKERPAVSINEILTCLYNFHCHVADAAAQIPKAARKGAALKYAEQALATSIAELLWRETGIRPTATRGRERNGGSKDSTFIQVLCILLAPHQTKAPTGSALERVARQAIKALPATL